MSLLFSIALWQKNKFLLCQSIGWLVYIVFIYTAYGVDSSHSLDKVLLYYTSEMLLGLGITCFLKKPLNRAKQCSPSLLFLITLSLTFIAAYVWTLLKVSIFTQLFDLLAHQTQSQTVLQWFPNSLSIIATWCAIYFAFHFGNANALKEKSLLKLASEANESKLKMLRYQLNPHFLFNTLASIRALVSNEDKTKARSMILELSDLLRYSLYTDPLALHSLNDELAILQRYINIEMIRYRDRLLIETCISQESQTVPIPSMLLQPLFENIIKHCVAYAIEPVQVKIKARTECSRLYIALENSQIALPFTDENTFAKGIGHENTLARLSSFYGKDFSFQASSIGSIYRVEIQLPINTTQGEENGIEGRYC